MWTTSACDASIFLGELLTNRVRISRRRQDCVCWDNVFLPWVTWLDSTFNNLLNFLPKSCELANCSLPLSFSPSLLGKTDELRASSISLTSSWILSSVLWRSTVCLLTASSPVGRPALCRVCWSLTTCSLIFSIQEEKTENQHWTPRALTRCSLPGRESHRNTLTITNGEGRSRLSIRQETPGERLWQMLSTRKARHTV